MIDKLSGNIVETHHHESFLYGERGLGNPSLVKTNQLFHLDFITHLVHVMSKLENDK